MRRTLEDPLERMSSEVEGLADRASEHPETIAEVLDKKSSVKKLTGWL